MNTPKHTKTPWVALRTIWVDPTSTEHRDQWIIKRDNPELDRPGEYVADLCGLEPEVQGLAKANAEMIVRAVNAHEQMTQALEAFQRSEVSAHVESYIKWCRESGPASHVETAERERICRAAYLAGWSAMWSSVSRQAEAALRAAKGEA